MNDIVMEALNIEGFILNDLLFTNKGSTFQIDSFLITGGGKYLLEIKNYEGDFQFDNRKFLTYSGEELSNPLSKLSLTNTKMKQLLKSWKIQTSFVAKIIFVNPQGMIYNAPADPSIIYPPQLNRFFSKLNQKNLPLSQTAHYLADKLLLKHQSEAAFLRKPPEYSYDSLKKGVWCTQCGLDVLSFSQRSCICQSCGHRSTVDDVIFFHAEEFRMLFPEEKMTTAALYQWTGKIISSYQIRKTLKKHYQIRGATRGSFYQ